MCCTIAPRGVALRFTFPEELVPQVQRGSGQRTGSAESAAPGGTALHQGTEARGGARAIEERRELNRVAGRLERQINFADWELMRQGLRLEPVLQAISDFLDVQQNVIERVPKRSGTRPEERPRPVAVA